MKITALLTLALSVLLSACVNLKPKPDRTQVFALASDIETVVDVTGKPECYIARVEFPGFIEGSRIFYRSANGELEFASGARWAETLAEALPRAFAMHLQATEQADVRAYYPWAKTAREAITIALQFERFSANAAGRVEVIARWQIEDASGAKQAGRYIAPNLVWDRINVTDYVAKLNAGLAGLAQTIAQELTKHYGNSL